MSLVSLHTHSFFSSLDGAGSIKKYIEKAKEYNHPALAISDHGNMSGTYDLFIECKKNGIKPLMACEFYVQADNLIVPKNNLVESSIEILDKLSEEPENEEDDDKNNKDDLKQLESTRYHQIVFAKNEIGWKNICKLNYYSFQKKKDKTCKPEYGSFYKKPRIKKSFLFDCHDGIIVTSTCMLSEINRLIMSGYAEEAYQLSEQYKKVFNDDFYFELQLNEANNEEVSQKLINSTLIEFSKSLDVKLILTNDTHYVNPADPELQDLLIATSQNKTIYDPKAFKLGTRSLYYADRKDYYKFSEKYGYGYSNEFIDQCLDNTLEIADKVNFEFQKNKNYPKYYKDEKDSKKKLSELILQEFKEYAKYKKFTKEQISLYINRIKYEYDIIEKNGYVDYFLVFWDIYKFCKENNIETGCGRGSGPASMVAFLLGLVNLDPIEHDLFFERFINPEALSTPDIDADFDSERRDEVIEYIKQKYGEESVVRIGNYNTFNVRGGLRDLVRGLARSKEDIDFVCINIPENISGDNIDEWFQSFKEMKDSKERRLYLWYQENNDVVEYFKIIHGQNRHISQHASGIIITPEPIYNFIPVNRIGDSVVTGYPEAGGQVGKEGKISRSSHKYLSELGIIKFDILGLQTVTLIRKTVELIQKNKNIDVRPEVYLDWKRGYNLNLNNPKLYEEFCKGNNFLVFQFESNGISEYIKYARPSTFAEIAAINSLYRPAALSSGAAMKFARVCSGQEQPEKIHPLVDEILKNTGNVIAFQEQASRIINACTGISFGQSELIRKGVSDRDIGKYPEKLQYFLDNFIPLSVKNNIDRDTAEKIKDYLYNNAGYLFNASHSNAYSVLALQTIWLKLNYPEEFYCIALSMNTKDEMSFQYIADASNHGVKILSPDVKRSNQSFDTIGNNEILCGLNVLKGLGPMAYKELMSKDRQWNNIVEFLLEDWKKLNKTGIEVLIKCGTLRNIEPNMKLALELAKFHLSNKANLGKLNRKKELKYSSEMLYQKYEELKLSRIIDYSDTEKDKLWHNVTGFIYPFRNKFIKYTGIFSAHNIVGISKYDSEHKSVYGEVLSVDKKQTKKLTDFYKVKITDGFTEAIFKVWDSHIKNNNNIPNGMFEGALVVVDLDKDDYGYTLSRNAKYLVLN